MAGQVEIAKDEEGPQPPAMESVSWDYELKSRLEKRLRLEDDIQWNNLSVQVNDGHAILHGTVSTMEGKGLATKLASTVPGVTQLENRIIVDPRLSSPEKMNRPHIEPTNRDRVLEASESLKDQQIMP